MVLGSFQAPDIRYKTSEAHGKAGEDHPGIGPSRDTVAFPDAALADAGAGSQGSAGLSQASGVIVDEASCKGARI